MFLPRYHIVRHVEIEEAQSIAQNNEKIWATGEEFFEHIGTYVIPETEFMAVTNYKSYHVKDTKIDLNPYSRAYRTFRQRALPTTHELTST